MKLFITVISSIIGVVFGFFIALFGTYYTCVIIDNITCATPGNGLVVVGWMFCFVTVPIGMLIGAFLGVFLTNKFYKKRENNH